MKIDRYHISKRIPASKTGEKLRIRIIAIIIQLNFIIIFLRK